MEPLPPNNVNFTPLSSSTPPHSSKIIPSNAPYAKKIQSVWRSYSAKIKVAKKRRETLSYALLEKARPYVDTPSSLQNLPRAQSGKTPVYFPPELPIVLKMSGSLQNQRRFDQMKEAREICEKSHSQNLVIPQARVCGNFIIESRLPITVHETKEAIGFYIENQERFTDAIKEFIGFLCQCTLSDITGYTFNPYGALSKNPLGRYDNIALYLEGDQGKIGLIDLEHFEPICSKEYSDWCFIRCLNAVCLFPHHLEEILEAAETFDPDIRQYQKALETTRDGSLKRFQLAYYDHLDFITANNITIETPLKMVEISSARKESIQESVSQKLKPELHGRCKQPEEALALFKDFFPEILTSTTNFLSERLKNQIEGAKKPISSYSQLLSYRTLRFDTMSCETLITHMRPKLTMMGITKSSDQFNLGHLIISSVFAELAKGGEIAYYNPKFGYQSFAMHCVFC